MADNININDTHPTTSTAKSTPPTLLPNNNPSLKSKISLREITESNWRAVANLRLPPHQAGNLAPNPMSMCEGHYSEDAWIRAVYAADIANTTDVADTTDSINSLSPIGFLMLALWPPTSGYYIWRLMIAAPYQGKGYGRDIVRAAIEYVRETYPEAKRLGVMSTPKEGCVAKGVKAEDSPFCFYEKLGFRQTEEPDEDGEVMMEVDL